jgi:hypothetical protein
MTTTFVDPLGITASGKTGIVFLAPTGSSVTPIPRDCGWMVAVMKPVTSNAQTALSDDAQIGDIVEVYFPLTNPNGATFSNLIVAVPAGESINGLPGQAEVEPGAGRIFRKVSATEWVTIGPSSGNP